MRLIKTLILLVFFCSISDVWAQDFLKQEFQERVGSATTNQHLKRRDRNGNMCAIIQISGADISKYEFASTVMVDSVEYDVAHNRATMFLVANQKRTVLTIMHPDFPNEKMELGALQSLHMYDLKLKVVHDKARTLVMPTVGIGAIPNYGVMLAFVKQVGPYFKFKSNFASVSDDGECTDAGNMPGTDKWPYYGTGITKSRMSFSGGVMYRFWQGNIGSTISTQSVYGYFGAGYGSANNYWETTDGKWLKNVDHSNASVIIETGVLYRYNAFAIMAGVETIGFKYTEFNIGLGVMF